MYPIQDVDAAVVNVWCQDKTLAVCSDADWRKWFICRTCSCTTNACKSKFPCLINKHSCTSEMVSYTNIHVHDVQINHVILTSYYLNTEDVLVTELNNLILSGARVTYICCLFTFITVYNIQEVIRVGTTDKENILPLYFDHYLNLCYLHLYSQCFYCYQYNLVHHSVTQ